MSKIKKVDRTLIPIIEQNFLSICQSLSKRTQQAAYSPLTMVGDLGTSISDEKGQNIMQWQTSYNAGCHIPVQAMIDLVAYSLPFCVRTKKGCWSVTSSVT